MPFACLGPAKLDMIGAMAPDKMAFASGDRIGDYEVLASLGAGGMGSVYKVRHAISQRIEALKVILPNASASPEMAERFLREIRLQASLEHPHIASLHNAFRTHNELVMVMEFVEGVSLRDKTSFAWNYAGAGAGIRFPGAGGAGLRSRAWRDSSRYQAVQRDDRAAWRGEAAGFWTGGVIEPGHHTGAR